jgi:DNA-binding CsgD family transcriptional regulator/PAS domain-containing protein
MRMNSGESHDAVLDRISDQFFELDQRWRFTRFNKSAEAQLRILGLNPVQVLGQVLWDVFPNPSPGDALRRAMAEREIVTHEGFCTPLQEWVENRICPTSDGGLAVFQHSTRTAGRGVWNVVTGEMIWSPETFHIYGFDPAITTPSMELLFGIVHPADRAGIAEAVETIVCERGTFDVRFRIVAHGVTKHIHCFGRAVVDEAEVLLEVVATIEDVTPRHPAIADVPESPGAMDLSQRQEEVLRDCASGYANQDIATRLGISVRTVEVHKMRGMRKQNMHSRRDVVRYALLHGWLQDG